MKTIQSLVILCSLFLFSCSSVKVMTDYDTTTDFSKYKTFAFYKKGIDKAEISDLDKRRILKAIETELTAKGLTKSENPDLLVSIFTKSRKRVDVSSGLSYGMGFGYGWYPYYYGNYDRVLVSKYTEGTLFVDFLDKDKKQLIWQGVGSGALRMSSPEKKEERIQEFVKEIIAQYPPSSKK